MICKIMLEHKKYNVFIVKILPPMSVNEILNNYFQYAHLPECSFCNLVIKKETEVNQQNTNYFRDYLFFYKQIISILILPILILLNFNQRIFIKIRGDTVI